jgi:hypothetical protein
MKLEETMPIFRPGSIPYINLKLQWYMSSVPICQGRLQSVFRNNKKFRARHFKSILV